MASANVDNLIEARNEIMTLKILYSNCGGHMSYWETCEDGYPDNCARREGNRMCFLLPASTSIPKSAHERKGSQHEYSASVPFLSHQHQSFSTPILSESNSSTLHFFFSHPITLIARVSIIFCVYSLLIFLPSDP